MQSLRLSLRVAPAIVAMGAMFLFAGVPQAHAQDDDDRRHECHERIEHARQNLSATLSQYGEGSREAAEARHELHEARERCGPYYDNNDGRWSQQNSGNYDQRGWDRQNRERDRHGDDDRERQQPPYDQQQPQTQDQGNQPQYQPQDNQQPYPQQAPPDQQPH